MPNTQGGIERPTCPCKRLPLSWSSWTGAEYGDVHTLQRLTNLSTRRDAAGQTPLHVAAAHGHMVAVQILLEAGCDVYDNMSGATALHRAAFSGAVGTMGLLLDAAQAQKQKEEYSPQTPTDNNRQNNEKDILFLPDTSFGDGRIPLHKAAAGGRSMAVHLLLQAHQAQGTLLKALQTRDAYQQTPLQVAQALARNSQVEAQHVARWNVVAGGQANFDQCVCILQDAIRTGRVEEVDRTTQALPFVTNTTGETRNAKQTFSAQECVDCIDGVCVTQAWEKSFQRGLMQAIEQSFQSVENQSKGDERVDVLSSVMEDKNADTASISSDAVMAHKKAKAVPIRGNGTTEISNPPLLGRCCDVCSQKRLSLYPVKREQQSSQQRLLVCRACKRAKQF